MFVVLFTEFIILIPTSGKFKNRDLKVDDAVLLFFNKKSFF